MESLIYIMYAFLGVLIGSVLSLVPGFYFLNLAAIVVAIYVAVPFVGALSMAMIFTGMLVAYAIVGVITTTFLGAPDDSMRYTIFPSQKYLMYGRGYEASMIGGIGALGALILLLLIAPLSGYVFPIFRKLGTPHMSWILIGVVAYLLQSEWPKDWGSRAKTRLGRLKDGWASLGAGWLVFFLSMMLGFIVLNVPVASPDKAFQNIMPVFAGFVAVPWVLTNAVARFQVPPQNVKDVYYVSKKDMARGTTAGFLGGTFVANEPILTAGIGAVLAGHSTSTSGDVQFMVSGSAGRFAYYVGAFFLMWVPLLHLTRKGTAIMTSVIYQPKSDSEFWLFVAAVALSAVLAFLLLILFSRFMAKIIPRYSYRKISIVVLVAVTALVFIFAGWEGAVIMSIATGIGLTQIMFRTRWMNLLIGFFFPIMLNMAGLGAGIAKFLVGY